MTALDIEALRRRYYEAHDAALPPEAEEGMDHEAADALALDAGLRAVAEAAVKAIASDAAVARAEAAEKERDDYRRAIVWEQSCLECARRFEQMRDQEERAERAEAEAGRLGVALARLADAAEAVWQEWWAEAGPSKAAMGALCEEKEWALEATKGVDRADRRLPERLREAEAGAGRLREASVHARHGLGLMREGLRRMHEDEGRASGWLYEVEAALERLVAQTGAEALNGGGA